MPRCQKVLYNIEWAACISHIDSAVGAWNESEDEKLSKRICTIDGLHHVKNCIIFKSHWTYVCAIVVEYSVRYGRFQCQCRFIWMKFLNYLGLFCQKNYTQNLGEKKVVKIGRSPDAKGCVALTSWHRNWYSSFTPSTQANLSSFVRCVIFRR